MNIKKLKDEGRDFELIRVCNTITAQRQRGERSSKNELKHVKLRVKKHQDYDSIYQAIKSQIQENGNFADELASPMTRFARTFTSRRRKSGENRRASVFFNLD